MSCQFRDFPQSFVVIPSAIATKNLFYNFYRLGPYFLLKLIFNILVCLVILLLCGDCSIRVMTVVSESDCSIRVFQVDAKLGTQQVKG